MSSIDIRNDGESQEQGPKGGYSRTRAGRVGARTIPDLPVGSLRSDDQIRLALPDGDSRLDLDRLFGNRNDVELEIGVGKGRFLLLATVSQPEKNFLGIEYARKYFEKTVDRIGKRGLTNVRLAHAEAVMFLSRSLNDASLAAAHVYFPDPWPKKRHHKRRFFRAAALDELARVLRPGALLRAATDHADYAEVIHEVMDRHAEFLLVDSSVVSATTPEDDLTWQLPGMGDYTRIGVTNFEIKYLQEGRPIRRYVWQRR